MSDFFTFKTSKLAIKLYVDLDIVDKERILLMLSDEFTYLVNCCFSKKDNFTIDDIVGKVREINE